jgi:RNA polymerase sigma-70 factor (ECF subfamily)
LDAVTDERANRRDLEQTMHARLLAGDPLATYDLFQHFAPRLIRRFGAKYPTTDSDLVEDAVAETMLDYFERPDLYNPAKRSLYGYLAMAAERDLLNLRQKHERRLATSRPIEPVELDAQARKQWEEGGDIVESLIDDESAAQLWMDAMTLARTDEERIVQRLRLEGERSTEAYAAELGWSNLSPAEQKRRLYQIKDRLDQRARRRGEHHG